MTNSFAAVLTSAFVKGWGWIGNDKGLGQAMYCEEICDAQLMNTGAHSDDDRMSRMTNNWSEKTDAEPLRGRPLP